MTDEIWWYQKRDFELLLPVETAIAGTVEPSCLAVKRFPPNSQAHRLQLGHALHLDREMCYQGTSSLILFCAVFGRSLTLCIALESLKPKGPKLKSEKLSTTLEVKSPTPSLRFWMTRTQWLSHLKKKSTHSICQCCFSKISEELREAIKSMEGWLLL